MYNDALTIAISSHYSDDIYYIKKKLAVIAFNSREYHDAEKLFLEVRNYHSQNGVPGSDIRILYTDLRLAEIYDYLQDYPYVILCILNNKKLNILNCRLVILLF